MFGRKKKTPKLEDYGKLHVYDYTSPEGRVSTAEWLFQVAKNHRGPQEQEWVRFNDYYNFIHGVSKQVGEFAEENDLHGELATLPDPFLMVDSQIDAKIPEPEFRGRDDDMDSVKARQREFAVKYIIENNRLEDRNTSNERRLLKLGDAFWKAYWDNDMMCGPHEGDIRVRDVPVEALYVDPTAGNEGIQAAQYIAYVYRVHKLEFWRLYNRDLKKAGVTLDEITGSEYDRADFFDMFLMQSEDDDTVQVMEFWFKQPFDTKDAPAGAVACSIQAAGHEIRYIPMYWKKTGQQGQNRLFPFVHYWRIRDENQFYNKSELFPILSLVDAADRCMATAQLNEDFTANDIILMEEDALADGEILTNEPGAVVKLRKNGIGKVQRLGGMHTGANSLNLMQGFLEQIQRATRNYDTNLGRETARVTTASGLLQIRSDADTQTSLKRADRNAGFGRLFELLDWLALEFYDDDRMLFLGAKKELGHETREAQSQRFNGDNFAKTMPAVLDAVSGETVRDSYDYYPRVDVSVTAGDGVAKSKSATLEILDKLAAVQATPENWKLLAAELEILDIPQKQEIIDQWRNAFEAPQEPEQDAAAVAQMSAMAGMGEAQAVQAGAPLGGEIAPETNFMQEG